MKNVLAVVSALLVLGMLAGCSGNNNPAVTSNQPADTSQAGTDTATPADTSQAGMDAASPSDTSQTSASNASSSLTLDQNSISVAEGSTYALGITSSSNEPIEQLQYSTSDIKTATVDNIGQVYGVQAGSAVITVASAANPSDSVQCNVTVTASPSAYSDSISLNIFPAAFASAYTTGRQTDPVALYLEHKYNVQLNWDMSADPAKLNTEIAAGSMPDIVQAAPASVDFSALVKGNTVLALDDLIASNGKDISTNAPDSITFSKEVNNFDNSGKLYFLPSQMVVNPPVPGEAFGGINLRWDYYAELGYPEITDYDSLISIIGQMIQNHPDNEDGLPFVGFSTWFDWGASFQCYWLGEYMEGKLTFGGANELQIDWDSLAMTNVYIDPNSVLWNGADFWYKVNKAGLLDPDSFTQTYDSALSKNGSNRVLCSMIDWPIGPSTNVLKAAGYDDRGYYGPVPMDGARNVFYNPLPVIGQNNFYYCISSKCANPERAMDVINWLYSTEGCLYTQNGLPDGNWSQDSNGDIIYSDSFIAKAKDLNINMESQMGARKYTNPCGFYYQSSIPGTKNAMDGWYVPTNANKNISYPVTDVLRHYGVESTNDVLPKGYTIGTNKLSVAATMMPTTIPDDIKQIDTQVGTYINNLLPKMFQAKSDDEYGQMKTQAINDIKAMNIDTSYSFYQSAMEQAIKDAGVK